jgi:hypothetical protein
MPPARAVRPPWRNERCERGALRSSRINVFQTWRRHASHSTLCLFPKVFEQVVRIKWPGETLSRAADGFRLRHVSY